MCLVIEGRREASSFIDNGDDFNKNKATDQVAV
jgi:hypothetical protein